MAIAKSKLIQSALGFAVSIGLIIWVFAGTDWSALGSELENMNFWILPWVTAVLFIHTSLRAWRWRYLLPEGNRAGLRQLFDSFMVGSFATYILPLRAGEFIRPYLLTRYTGISFSTTFVSIIVERFFDLSVILLCFGAIASIVPGLPDWVNKGAWALSLLAICIFVLMVIGTFFPAFVLKCARFFLRLLPEKVARKIEHFLSDFLKGAAVLRHGERLLIVVGLSLLVWSSSFFLTHEYFRLFHLAPGPLTAVTLAILKLANLGER